MKISSSAYFAVESLVRLAAYDAKRPCSVETLSHSVGCSESFTEQLTTDVNGTAGAAPRTNTQRSNDTVQSCEEGVMTFIAENLAVATRTDGNRLQTIALRLRKHLQIIAERRVPTTYQDLAAALELTPPRTIHQVTEALEHLMTEDSEADRPFIAAIAISKARGGLPAPGFFDRARRLGRFDGDEAGLEAWAFHAREFNAAVAFWTATATTGKSE